LIGQHLLTEYVLTVYTTLVTRSRSS